ncbi:somatostatin receptor type 5 [Scomber scombrus]|uniref:Somatostatin receptor type 5 n=1 Tax=Scomber scombrus TaxID=13677 RepID=A0AAV1NTJ0_SCOSC
MDSSFLPDIDYNQTYVDEQFYAEDNIDGFGITMAILYLVVCILGLAGNSLVIVAILKLDKITPRCAKIVSAFLWLFSLLTILPMALHFSAERGLCIPELVSGTWWLGVLSYTFVMGFALPFTVMTASYTALLLTLKSKRLQATTPNPESHRLEKQVTKMVVAVVVVFGICWLPFYTFNFCSLYQNGLVLTFARAFEVVVLLSYSWSCANPILYTCLSETFRRHFRTLLCPTTKTSPSMQCNTERYDLTNTDVRDITILA